jgi:hypothetical protein
MAFYMEKPATKNSIKGSSCISWFSTSKLADGMLSEFLYLKVPSGAFIRIAAGKDVRLRLGEKDYRLDEQQVVLIKKMSIYLKK